MRIQVVAIGAGTKFMPQDAIDADTSGECIHDGHAEVLARRAFLRFLYLQMQGIIRGSERDACCPAVLHQVFDTRDDMPGPRFSWNHNIGLHFYTSAQPCGMFRSAVHSLSIARDDVHFCISLESRKKNHISHAVVRARSYMLTLYLLNYSRHLFLQTALGRISRK